MISVNKLRALLEGVDGDLMVEMNSVGNLLLVEGDGISTYLPVAWIELRLSDNCVEYFEDEEPG